MWLKAYGIIEELTEEERYKRYALIPEKKRKHFERNQARKLHVELDLCQGCCLLRVAGNAQILSQALLHFHGTRCWIGDFIIMPNHVHLLVQPFEAHSLEEWLKSVKIFASRRFEKNAMEEGRVFQQESYDRIVRNKEELSAYRKYIADNGIKARLRDSDYLFHKCAWL